MGFLQHLRHDFVPEPGINRFGEKSFLWNFWLVFHDGLLEKSQAETRDVYYHKLRQGAGRNCSYHSKTAKCFGPLLLQGAYKQTTKQCFLLFFFFSWSNLRLFRKTFSKASALLNLSVQQFVLWYTILELEGWRGRSMTLWNMCELLCVGCVDEHCLMAICSASHILVGVFIF